MSNSANFRFSKTWNWRAGLLWLLAAATLFASWLAPGTRAAWRWADEQFFYVINGTVAWGEPAAAFWAVTGSVHYDVLGALLFGLVCLFLISRGGSEEFRRGLAYGVMTGIALAIVIAIQKTLFEGLLIWPRESPSLVLEPHYSISAVIDWSVAKETAAHSFPSDHGTVWLLLATLLWRGLGARVGIAAAIAAVMFITPRMGAGAHWLTDTAAGAAAVVLLVHAIAHGTPLLWMLYQRIRPLSDAVAERLASYVGVRTGAAE